MEQSPYRKAHSHSDSQEILRPFTECEGLLARLLFLILGQIHPFHPISLKIYSNIIFPSTPRSSEWSLTSRFSDQNFISSFHLFHVYYTPRPSLSPPFGHPNNIW